MLLLLNYQHNKMKKEAAERQRKKKKEEKADQEGSNVRRRRQRSPEESSQQEGMEEHDPMQKRQQQKNGDHKKRKAGGGVKKRRFVIPREKMWEAYTIFLIGFGIPATYGLYNVGCALCRYATQQAANVTVVAEPQPEYRFSEYSYKPQVHPDSVPASRLASVDRRSGLSLEEYYGVYDAKWPVVISDCVPNWEAARLWDEEFFASRYGSARVSMAAISGRLDSAQQLALPMNMFISHLNDSSPTSWTYLQDELFLPTRPELLAHIGTCGPLREDFFSLFPESARPWWAFLLWGTRHSRSQLHIDPYNWTGTNAVLRGRKRWKLYLPGQDHLLYPRPQYLGKYPLSSHKYNSFADAFDALASERFPLLERAKYIEFVQQPGELLIIPTGWFHQAYNEEPTLAISGQLMNRGNYRTVLEELFKAGNLPRTGYPANFESLTPSDQTALCVQSLSAKALAEAAAVTRDVVDQLEREGRQNADRSDL